MARTYIPGAGYVDLATQGILDPKDLSAGTLFKGAAARSGTAMLGSAFDIIPAMVASTFGADDYAKKQLE